MKGDSFKIHQVAGRIGYMTLVEYPDKLLLFDTGSKNDYKRIETFLKYTLRRPMADIRLVAISHVHPDHSGGASELQKKYSLAVAGHPDLDKWYDGFRGRLQQVADVIFSHISAMQNDVPARRFWFNRKVRPDYPLKDGEPLPFFPDWVACHTIGHTTTDIVFYHEISKTLYVGDVIIEINNGYHLPYSLPLPRLMSASLKKLAALEVNTLILPHGGIKHPGDMAGVVAPLFNEIHRKLRFPVGLLKPLTMLSPEIEKHRPAKDLSRRSEMNIAETPNDPRGPKKEGASHES